MDFSAPKRRALGAGIKSEEKKKITPQMTKRLLETIVATRGPPPEDHAAYQCFFKVLEKSVKKIRPPSAAEKCEKSVKKIGAFGAKKCEIALF